MPKQFMDKRAAVQSGTYLGIQREEAKQIYQRDVSVQIPLGWSLCAKAFARYFI